MDNMDDDKKTDFEAECHALVDWICAHEKGAPFLYVLLTGVAFSDPTFDNYEEYEAAVGHIYEVGLRIHEEGMSDEEQV